MLNNMSTKNGCILFSASRRRDLHLATISAQKIIESEEYKLNERQAEEYRKVEHSFWL